jgi:hypothetical protein
MTLEELSRCARLWGFNPVFSVFSYREGYKMGVFVSPKDGNWSMRSVGEGVNGSIDPRDPREYAILGNKRPWRSLGSFSQIGGQFVFRWVIGFIGIAMGCCIDRGAEALF